MAIQVNIYEQSKDIPDLPGTNVFHSTELFQILEQTPGYRPVLLVAWEGNKAVGKLLCITRRNARITGLCNKTYAYGTGEYFHSAVKDETIFGKFLSYLTVRFQDDSFFLEFRNLEQSLFGYKYFRQNGYFPVRWLRVRNSIHHTALDKWASPSRKRQIARGLKNGAQMDVVNNRKDLEEFFAMLRKYYASKIHRFLPDLRFFISLLEHPTRDKLGQIFVIRYKKQNHRRLCLPFFARHCLLTILCRNAEKLSPTLSRHLGCMESHDLFTPTRIQTFRIHRSWHSFQKIYIP